MHKYSYPNHVITAAMMQKIAHYGVNLKIHRKDCIRIKSLDAQKATGKKIFGGGLLLSEKAAAEKAAAEKAAAEKKIQGKREIETYKLSKREIAVVQKLGME